MTYEGTPYAIIGTTIYWLKKTLTVVFVSKEDRHGKLYPDG